MVGLVSRLLGGGRPHGPHGPPPPGVAPGPAPGDDFITALYHDRLEWFRDVQTRAQVLLTIDGIFTGFLTGTLLGKANDVRAVVDHFGPETWAFLLVMGLALGLSLLLTVAALNPRLSKRQVTAMMRKKRSQNPYPADVMWWFMLVSRLADSDRYIDELVNAPADLKDRALAFEVYSLGKHLEFKFAKVRTAFRCTSIALIAFLATGGSYLYHVAR
jgi:Family of unknown function (DUF5706)